MKLDNWQQEVLNTEGNICLRSGRQVGKSTIISVKAAEYAIKNPGKTIMVVASVERQALLLFEKIHAYLHDNHKTYIKKGKDRPTKHKLVLTNGSTIYSLPTGLSGYGIRGYTVDLLIADEAAFIPEEVWTAITPMLAITRGNIILLSTPFGKQGYFYRCSQSDNFTQFHISSEDCPRRDDKFLAEEKKRMSELSYAQEYLGEFVDELRQFFPTDLIKKCMVLSSNTSNTPIDYDTFLGVDVARMGGDDTVFAGMACVNRKKLKQTSLDILKNFRTTEVAKRIIEDDKRANYKTIYIDDGGLGVGVFDMLLDNDSTKRKVVAINNAARALDHEDTRRKKLLKEDLYNNLLNLMERGKVQFFDDPEIMLSLKSVQCEHKHDQFKIFGKYTHVAEALIRAAWCMKDKRLNIWVR